MLSHLQRVCLGGWVTAFGSWSQTLYMQLSSILKEGIKDSVMIWYDQAHFFTSNIFSITAPHGVFSHHYMAVCDVSTHCFFIYSFIVAVVWNCLRKKRLVSWSCSAGFFFLPLVGHVGTVCYSLCSTLPVSLYSLRQSLFTLYPFPPNLNKQAHFAPPKAMAIIVVTTLHCVEIIRSCFLLSRFSVILHIAWCWTVVKNGRAKYNGSHSTDLLLCAFYLCVCVELEPYCKPQNSRNACDMWTWIYTPLIRSRCLKENLPSPKYSHFTGPMFRSFWKQCAV